LRECFIRHGLTVIDVERLATHGGSLRVLVAPTSSCREPAPAVTSILAEERAALLDHPEGFAQFGERARACCDGLVRYLAHCRETGRRVVGYGAAAKGVTLLNYAGIGPDLLPFVVDRNPHKQGRLMPGSHVPIREPEALVAARPDLVLVLPWNLRDEIVEQMAVVRSWGGTFIVAVPTIVELP
ncbi:MAG TPA: methyltransferase C-terminal domain-containing protein, partial [Acidimicrobiales bacterium]|nr:methyltransferase C-terminal domain-containing protein [Acidimicrobiales bacterium]